MRLFASFLLTMMVSSVACSRPATDVGDQKAKGDDVASSVTELADLYVESYFDAFPYQAVAFGAPDRHPGQLVDHSLGALEAWQGQEDALLERLLKLDQAAIEGRPESVTYKFLQNQLEASRGFRSCRMELWNVSPTWTGWQGELPLLAGQVPVATETDRKNAIARFSRLPEFLDTEIDNLTEGLALGFSAPAGNVRVVIEQMDAMLKAPIGAAPFVQMAGSDQDDFRAELEKLEQEAIRPAIRKYRDFLADVYLAQARAEVGVSANPNGGDCYRAAVKYHATVEMTAEQVHEIGLEQMRLIQSQMREIGERSFGISDPAELLRLVKSDAKYRFESREQLIAYAEAAVERGKEAMPRAFGVIPRAQVVVEPYPTFLEKSAPGGQAIAPTPDGKPGKYMINAYKANEQSRAGLESTAFHEAYPGHHMQIAVALEREGLHPISRYFFLSGFGEGWALYSERLSDELGLFSSDVDRLGLLSNEALRAARLVVDSGMHALGWTRQQAIDYLLAHTTETRARGTAEIDRYIAVPGQATAYMIGNLEIRRLREAAEEALGERFELPAFHDLVLEDGGVPLWVLGEKVEAWIGSLSVR